MCVCVSVWFVFIKRARAHVIHGGRMINRQRSRTERRPTMTTTTAATTTDKKSSRRRTTRVRCAFLRDAAGEDAQSCQRRRRRRRRWRRALARTARTNEYNPRRTNTRRSRPGTRGMVVPLHPLAHTPPPFVTNFFHLRQESRLKANTANKGPAINISGARDGANSFAPLPLPSVSEDIFFIRFRFRAFDTLDDDIISRRFRSNFGNVFSRCRSIANSSSPPHTYRLSR